MAIRLLAPEGSFVKFVDTTYEHCIFGTIKMNLPVFDETDVAFQFYLETDTLEEANALSAVGSGSVVIGITSDAGTLAFSAKPERFRLDDKLVLYNWTGGMPDFESIVGVNECFSITVTVTIGSDVYSFTSNQFYRISEYDACYTSVLDYGSDENAFGFNYCASNPASIDEDDDGGEVIVDPLCEPTIIKFTNRLKLDVPYLPEMVTAYGTIPTVEVWLYDGIELVKSIVEIKFDADPPTVIKIDFGGNASGIVIIK